MTLIEKVLALQHTPPFDRLHDAELTLIAEVASDRRYAPGEVLVSEGRPLSSLLVVIHGDVDRAHGTRTPRMVGIESLLFDVPVAGPVTASREGGAVCLLITKSHLHTIVNACPELVLGLLEAHPGPVPRIPT